MGTGDNLQPAYPQNTHKQDWAFYPFVGGRGAGELTATADTRYSFWIDFDPFNIRNLKMLSQNVSFALYADIDGNTPLIPYFIADQSNDITDEIIEANLPSVPGTSTSYGTASINYPIVRYSDNNGGVNVGNYPPTSGVAGPTGVYATLAPSGSLSANTTYYYCMTWYNVSTFTESLPSSVVSATTTSQDETIEISFTPVAGASWYNIYRNTTNNFSSGGGSILVNAYYAGQPPYYVNVGQPPQYINTVFAAQPSASSFKNDQGNYTLAGYQGRGYAFGNSTMVCQGFVPTQSQLTAISFGGLFHTNTTDPTTYYQLNFELWSSSKTFIQHLGSLQPTVNPSEQAGGFTTDTAYCTASCTNYSYVKGTDGNNYWTNLTQPILKFTKPISVTPGTTYYIVVRQQTASASAYYSLGTNTNASSVRDPLHYYMYASAYSATDGSSTWTQLVDTNSKPITFPFLTRGSIGRYAITYWWANEGTAYWLEGVPNNNNFIFLHVDFNQRI